MNIVSITLEAEKDWLSTKWYVTLAKTVLANGHLKMK